MSSGGTAGSEPRAVRSRPSERRTVSELSNAFSKSTSVRDSLRVTGGLLLLARAGDKAREGSFDATGRRPAERNEDGGGALSVLRKTGGGARLGSSNCAKIPARLEVSGLALSISPAPVTYNQISK